MHHVVQPNESRDSCMSDKGSGSISKVGAGDIFKVFRESDEPVLSTTDIINEIDHASKSTVRRRLNTMRDNNELRSKKSGEKENDGVVWYPPNELPEIPQPTPKPLVLIYTHPWFSIMVGGLLSAGLGFLFFLPGILGEGSYLGIIDRDWLIGISIILYSVGVSAVYVGGAVIVGKFGYSIFKNRRQESDDRE